MFKNIMLAVDGSIYTDFVLSLGISIAKTFHSHLHVLTVADIRVFEWATAISTDGFVPIAPTSLYQQESMRILDEKCQKVIDKCSRILDEQNIDYEAEKMVSSPAQAIIERSQIADLIILGKCGEFSRWDRKRLGATVESVSRTIRKPMIVVDKVKTVIKKMLVCYDGSPHSNQALLFAGHLAENFNSAITVLSVNDDEKLGKHFTDEAEKYLKNYKINLNSVVRPGVPDKEIVKFAEENSFDLVAIGAFGHSRIRETILGSNTEHILRFAPCHVILTK